MARAASAGILVVLVHSVAEFPLRTVTLTAILALMCAILERSRGTGETRSGQQPAREPSGRQDGTAGSDRHDHALDCRHDRASPLPRHRLGRVHRL